MAKTPKTGTPTTAPDAEPAPQASAGIPVQVSAAQIDKARKHLEGRLRLLVLQSVFTTGEPGLIARTIQDITALGMINPLLGDEPLKEKPKAPSVEEALAEQAAAQLRHQRDEERESLTR